MANTSKGASRGTSAGSVSHDRVGKVPRAVAQGFEEQERAAFVEGVPALSRGLMARALAGAASPRQAIKAFCLACTHYDRDEISHCPVWRCPLHAYRPRWPSALAEGSDPSEESVSEGYTSTATPESGCSPSSGAAAADASPRAGSG
jgi:hypothetical protein